MRRLKAQAKVDTMVLPWGEEIKLTPGEWYMIEVTITSKKKIDGSRGGTLETDILIVKNGFFSPLV